jgi:lipoprotein-releasing system ATP-binding protein
MTPPFTAATQTVAPEAACPDASLRQAPVIQARDLRKSFGSKTAPLTILDGVNLEIAAGELLAIVGPSGTGKSTLLHLLAALDTPTSGTVYFAQKALETLSEDALADFRNRSIGFVWQRHHLLSDFTAGENVAMPLLMRGTAREKALRQAEQWLDQVGLASRVRHRAGELSGGEQQRVAIARALVNGPAVLLADEPTGDLDEGNAEAVFELMQNLHKTHGLTSIIATHNFGISERCDRTLALEHGHLVSRERKNAGRPTSGPAGANLGGEGEPNRV